jgi:hypothetical protein
VFSEPGTWNTEVDLHLNQDTHREKQHRVENGGGVEGVKNVYRVEVVGKMATCDGEGTNELARSMAEATHKASSQRIKSSPRVMTSAGNW